jgi:HAE1 family hydrophobic/amphiphilic exporter-1
MNWLAAICIKRPVFAMVLILILTVFGIVGYTTLGVDRYPKIDFPMVTVTTRLTGAAPEEVETEITDKIEEAVNTVSGIEELRSASAEGVSLVYITFAMEKDVDVAAQDVRDRVNRVLPDLPKNIDQPTVEKMDPDAMPVITVAVSAPAPLRDITEYCDKVLRRRLETIAGVGQVKLVGGQARQINVNLDPLKLRGQKLTIADAARSLGNENLQVPGGSLKQGQMEFTLRTLGRVTRAEDLKKVTVASQGGRVITIGDLGSVEDSTAEMESAALYGEKDREARSVLLTVRKQSGTNTVEVARLVKQRLVDLARLAPRGYHIEVVRDQSIFIEAETDAVKEHLVLGGFLAGVVVLFFLANFRATIIAAISIPTSIVATFAAIKYVDFTLNMVTLLALTLSVGIVIDDAIVVMENIFRYIETKQYRPFEAALAATKEIGLAVLAITLSLVAVFLPIGFMGGIVGKFLKCFGVTMSVTVVASMFVSFTLTPMMAARWFKAADPEANVGDGRPGRRPRRAAWLQVYTWIEAAYRVLLEISLRHRWVVVLAVVVALGSTPLLLKAVRVNFLPDDDQSDFEIGVQAPEGTSLEATQALVARMARDVRKLNGVRYTIASVADDEQHTANKGTIYVRLVGVSERSFSQMDSMGFVRTHVLPAYATEHLRLSVSPASEFSGGGTSNADVQYMIGGPDVHKLEQYAQQVMESLRKVPGAVDVDSSLTGAKPQVGATIDRAKAGQLGVSVADVANTLRLLVAGQKVSDYNEGGEQYEVRVRAMAEARNQIDALAMVSVPSGRYGTIPIADVVSFQPGTGPAQIDRLDRTRQVTISANLAPGTSQQGVLAAIDQTVAQMRLPPEYHTGLLGRSKEMAKMLRGFILVVVMSFVFVYLVIAAQFESWLHPITILLSLPLTFPFALIALILFNQSLNLFSMLGVLVLFAVVKKNSILQIDHTNQLRAAGMPRNDAMIAANLDRLRPILMTTVAFVAGMFPLLVSNAAGAATNKAISAVVIGGQTLSLLLTLIATPVAYSLFDDLAQWCRGQGAPTDPRLPPPISPAS